MFYGNTARKSINQVYPKNITSRVSDLVLNWIQLISYLKSPIEDCRFSLAPNIYLFDRCNPEHQRFLELVDDSGGGGDGSECKVKDARFFLARERKQTLEIYVITRLEHQLLTQIRDSRTFKKLESRFGFDFVERTLPSMIGFGFCRFSP